MKDNHRGFISLISILTITAISLVIASAVLLRSITEATISVDQEKSNKAWATVNACAEVAIWRLKATSTTNYLAGGWDYSGNDEVDVGENTCYIYSIDGQRTGTSTSRTINASSTVDIFTRKLTVTVSTNSPVTIINWELVADF